MRPVIRIRQLGLTTLLGVLILAAAPARAASYDPLNVPASPQVRIVDRVVHDTARNRDIPVRIYLPEATAPAPVILFSHGLGGSRENSPYLGRHWAARGYVVVFMQHAGSDEAVWSTVPPDKRMGALRDAASLGNFMLRVGDVPSVLDQLAVWNGGTDEALSRRFNLEHVGMSGHSFGAVTTQAVSGQRYLSGQRSLADARITAAMMMSPSTPQRGSAQDAFSKVSIPWLLMTGTLDASPIGDATADSRLGVFKALPAGGKYELVLDGAEHSAFSDRPLPGDKQARNPNHHRVVLAISTAFWDAWLRDDKAARAWLDGAGPQSVLEKTDRWQLK
jgi:predicted dienelactone hydrolase